MANYEFQCPQFVDFAAELDEDKDTMIIGSSLYSPAQPAFGAFKRPFFPQINGLGNAGGFKQSTPMCKAASNQTDSDKAGKACLSRRVSKSEECLSKKNPRPGKPVGLLKRKRSVSDSHLHVANAAVTPMCLKRTTQRAGKKPKSSEELELEKIAQMRLDLKQQLRRNERNLKRMRLGQNVVRAPKSQNVERAPQNVVTEPKFAPPKSNHAAPAPVKVNAPRLQWNPFLPKQPELPKPVAKPVAPAKATAKDTVFGPDFIPPRTKCNAHRGIPFVPSVERQPLRPNLHHTSALRAQDGSFLSVISRNKVPSLSRPLLLSTDKENLFMK